MLILKEVINDIKYDYNNAKKNIDKAMKYKNDNQNLSEEYYNRSVSNLENINSLHDNVVDIINEYHKENGEAPNFMENIWSWEHDNMIEGITEIKQLQDYYKTL